MAQLHSYKILKCCVWKTGNVIKSMVSTYTTRINTFWEFTGLLLIFMPVTVSPRYKSEVQSYTYTDISRLQVYEMHLFLHVKIHPFHKFLLRPSMRNVKSTHHQYKLSHTYGQGSYQVHMVAKEFKLDHINTQCCDIRIYFWFSENDKLVLYFSIQRVWKSLNTFLK